MKIKSIVILALIGALSSMTEQASAIKLAEAPKEEPKKTEPKKKEEPETAEEKQRK